MKWIDSNIFLRYWDGLEEPRMFLDKIKLGGEKYKISAFVVTEIEWVMRSFYKEKKSDITEYIDAFLEMDNLLVKNETNIDKAMEIFKKYNIKLVDAVIAEAMAEGDTIVSYDHDFDKLSGIKRVEPKDLL
jgi:predicted nucleic acid-binding protein